MHARTRLTLDLLKSFLRTEHKGVKLLSYGTYYASKLIRSRTLEKYRAGMPIHAFILLTSRCNMSCEDCCFVDVINKKDVGRLDYDLAQISQTYEQPIFRAVSRVVLFGGEPTLCKGYVDVIKFFRRKGLVVCLTSNALRVDRSALEAMRDADLNMLNMTIYDKTERGQKYNLDKLEEAFEAASQGCFDVDRMGLCYHSTTIEGYAFAYEFARKVGARHLLFNRTYYTEANPFESSNPFTEARDFAEQYNALCGVIEREHRLTLYRPRQLRNSKVCSYTSNAVVMGPTNAVSPCCLITPKPTYGSVDDPRLLLAFKNGFIEGRLPAICRGCHMLGAEQF